MPQPQFSLMRANGKVVPLKGDALEFHPLCLAFPELPDDEQAALNADVKSNGVRDAGWLYEGKILDGRNRYRAMRRWIRRRPRCPRSSKSPTDC